MTDGSGAGKVSETCLETHIFAIPFDATSGTKITHHFFNTFSYTGVHAHTPTAPPVFLCFVMHESLAYIITVGHLDSLGRCQRSHIRCAQKQSRRARRNTNTDSETHFLAVNHVYV